MRNAPKEDNYIFKMAFEDVVVFIFDVTWIVFALLVIVMGEVIDYAQPFVPEPVDGSVFVYLDLAKILSDAAVLLFMFVNLLWFMKQIGIRWRQYKEKRDKDTL